MNCFEDAFSVFNVLNRSKVKLKKENGDVQLKSFNVSFLDPEPNYFDGMFSTKFEKCLLNKFEGLDNIHEVRSDYVKR